MNSPTTISIPGFGALLAALALSMTVTAQEPPLTARSVFHLEGELSKEPASMTRYVTQEPRFRTADAVAELAKVFDLEGKVEERERKFLVKNDLRVLELFRDKGTGYIRYSDNAELGAEKAASALPEPDEAVAKSGELLKANGLLPENAVLLGTRYAEFELTGNKGEAMAAGNSSIAAIYGFELDGRPVLGPGAKAGVVFGNDAKVIGASLIWRPVEPEGEMEIISPAEAFERFEGHLALEYKLDGARVQVHKQGDEVRVYSRQGNEVTAAVPEIGRDVPVGIGFQGLDVVLEVHVHAVLRHSRAERFDAVLADEPDAGLGKR